MPLSSGGTSFLNFWWPWGVQAHAWFSQTKLLVPCLDGWDAATTTCVNVFLSTNNAEF